MKNVLKLECNKVTNIKKGEEKMANKTDYFDLSRVVSLILAIFPFTAWVLGVVIRIQEGKIVAGILRIPFGWLAWIFDAVYMITQNHIWRWLDC